MKKYRLKVDSPWGKKGDIANLNKNGVMYYGQNTNVKPYPIIICFTPDNFPEIFEEVIEPSDEEWLAKWCHDHWLIKWPDYPYVEYKNKNIEFKNQWERLANALIQHGFDVKKLRGES